MQKLLLSILAVGLSALSLSAGPATVGGTWQLTMDSPHGRLTGPFKVEQDGSKLTAVFEAAQIGTVHFTGTVEGTQVAFEVADAAMGFKMTGAVEGGKMSGTTSLNNGAWTATRGSQTSVLGTVTRFKTDPLEIGVKPDSGAALLLKFGPETEVVRVPPGAHGLDKAEPSSLTSIAIGDRVMVSFAGGMDEARRIVLMPAGDIAKRNEAEKLDWQNRGISGVVASKSANEIELQIRTATGAHSATAVIAADTKVRRYAPDSVKFTDAEPGTVADIAVGDQLQARGRKSQDGSKVMAEDIVFGTFLTRVGFIIAVHPASQEIEIEDLATKQRITVKIAAASQLKSMPDVRVVPASHAEAPPAQHGAGEVAPPGDRSGILKMIEAMPAASFDKLIAGGGVIVTSTRGVTSDKVTAIMVLANADSLLQAAGQAAARQGKSTIDVISGMHGGMLSGPTGLSLPAIVQ